MWAKIGMWFLTRVVLATAVRESDRAGVALFSDRNALSVRKRIIEYVLTWLEGVSKSKWGKRIKSDEQAARFWKIVMKSDTIGKRVGEGDLQSALEFIDKALFLCGKGYNNIGSSDVSLMMKYLRDVKGVISAKNLNVTDESDERR